MVVKASVSLIAKLVHTPCTHIDDVEYTTEETQIDGEVFEQEIMIAHVRPFKRSQLRCPICGKVSKFYDYKYPTESKWRGPNLNGMPLYYAYRPARIQCPLHGILTESIPWADGKSRFLEDFNNEAAFLALNLPKTAIAKYLSINWRTVGNSVKAAHQHLEPNVLDRIHKRTIRRICVDETSYKKGFKYITVVIDMDTSNVLWAHEDHGDEIFRLFCEELTEEERKAVQIVAGDGAQWIDRMTKQYFPNAKRCIDPFHAVSWITDALDETRLLLTRRAAREFEKEAKVIREQAEKRFFEWQQEYAKYVQAKNNLENLPKRRGNRPQWVKDAKAFVECFESEYGDQIQVLANAKSSVLTEEEIQKLTELETMAEGRKGTKYVLGMNPEHLSSSRIDRLKLIEASDPDLWKAYQLKEQFRTIIHMTDIAVAKPALEAWIEAAKTSGFPAFEKIAAKIEKAERFEGIMNSIQYGESSSKSEQTNGLIKKLIRMACGFRNTENMFALIYLRCSDLIIPLAHRYTPSYEIIMKQREKQKLQRLRREAQKKARYNQNKPA